MIFLCVHAARWGKGYCSRMSECACGEVRLHGNSKVTTKLDYEHLNEIRENITKMETISIEDDQPRESTRRAF